MLKSSTTFRSGGHGRLTLCNRRSARHISRRAGDMALRSEMRQLAQKKPACGYRMLHGALRLDGWHFTKKRIGCIEKND